MLLTEDQARTKWCPHALQSDTSAGYNRTTKGAVLGTCLCVASECMAWRWDKLAGGMIHRRVYHGTQDYDGYRSQRFAKTGETFFQFYGAWWRYEHTSSDSNGVYDLIVRSLDDEVEATGGYCGLAGMPGVEP